jgi:hypothetical protein
MRKIHYYLFARISVSVNIDEGVIVSASADAIEYAVGLRANVEVSLYVLQPYPHSHPYFVHATFSPSIIFTFHPPVHVMNFSRRSFRSSFQDKKTVELILLICFT